MKSRRYFLFIFFVNFLERSNVLEWIKIANFILLSYEKSTKHDGPKRIGGNHSRDTQYNGEMRQCNQKHIMQNLYLDSDIYEVLNYLKWGSIYNVYARQTWMIISKYIIPMFLFTYSFIHNVCTIYIVRVKCTRCEWIHPKTKYRITFARSYPVSQPNLVPAWNWSGDSGDSDRLKIHVTVTR